MTEQDLGEINWTAVFIGFGVDWAATELLAAVVTVVMFALKGTSADNLEVWPADVALARQVVGVMSAVVGGMIAGYIARRRGTLHGLLASVLGLFTFICLLLALGGASLNVGDLGFVVLNLVGAGYGGGLGERWRARREKTQ